MSHSVDEQNQALEAIDQIELDKRASREVIELISDYKSRRNPTEVEMQRVIALDERRTSQERLDAIMVLIGIAEKTS